MAYLEVEVLLAEEALPLFKTYMALNHMDKSSSGSMGSSGLEGRKASAPLVKLPDLLPLNQPGTVADQQPPGPQPGGMAGEEAEATDSLLRLLEDSASDLEAASRRSSASGSNPGEAATGSSKQQPCSSKEAV